MFKKIKGLKREVLETAGVLSGNYAYVGPKRVELHLTNHCNNNCIACWMRSPLLGGCNPTFHGKKPPDDWESWKNRVMPYDVAISLVDELKEIGTKEIDISGGGEPFMYPRLMDVVSHIKKRGLNCSINTNFTLLNKEVVEKIVDLKIDSIVASIWAGSAEIYDEVHPNKNKETFYDIKNTLSHLVQYRNKKKQPKPTIEIFNVIFNMNYMDLENMLTLALETGADFCNFTLADLVPDRTECLKLNEIQRKKLFSKFQNKDKKLRGNGINTRKLVRWYDDFIRRISQENTVEGEYDEDYVHNLPCYAGWTFAEIEANGNVLSCCKSGELPVGNICKDGGFKKVWNSLEQRKFREETININRRSVYFSKIKCERVCDNLNDIRPLYERIKNLSLIKKFFLKLLGHCLKPFCILRYSILHK